MPKTIAIYSITNMINGKIYIGQSWNIEDRFRDYKTYRSNSHLRAAFKKYGIDNFHFGIVEMCSEAISQEELDEREDLYIVLGNRTNNAVGYNMRRGGSHGRHNEESKKLISKNQIGKKLSVKHKQAIGEGCRGIKHSKESIKRGIETRQGLGGYVISDQTRERLRQSHIGKKQSRESVEKMLKWRRENYVISDETKRKISESNKGVIRSDEWRRKQSEAQKGKPWGAARRAAHNHRRSSV